MAKRSLLSERPSYLFVLSLHFLVFPSFLPTCAHIFTSMILTTYGTVMHLLKREIFKEDSLLAKEVS